LMKGGWWIQGRYAWHMAEYLHSLYGLDLVVEYGGNQFRVPHHPLAPRRNHVNFPLVEARGVTRNWDQRLQEHAHFDAYLYAAGQEHYQSPLYLSRMPFDGILMLLVKMRVSLHTTSDAAICDILGRMSAAAYYFSYALMPVNAKGTRNGWEFAKGCPVILQPRFLVETISDDPDFLTKNQVQSNQQYLEKVDQIEAKYGFLFHVHTMSSGSIEWLAPNVVTVSGAAENTIDFVTLYMQMLGLEGNLSASEQSLLPVVQTVIPNARVERFQPPKGT
jgi:hypothetical protein